MLPAPASAARRGMPPLLYGTAWKEERTEALVALALEAGFRGFDTANQRKHYHEAGVGAAIQRALEAGLVAREDLFLQTKFTFARGQDHRLPYDPSAPVAEQVRRSFESSLAHLGVERLDALLLHGPSSPIGLGEADLEAWRAMEEIHRDGLVSHLGASNVSAAQLEALHASAAIPPAIVQDRTFTRPRADAEVRSFCEGHDVVYEGFSLLTAIVPALRHPAIAGPAARLHRTPAEVVFAWALGNGIVVLTGTTSREHMTQDLAIPSLELLPEEDLSIAALLTGEAPSDRNPHVRPRASSSHDGP